MDATGLTFGTPVGKVCIPFARCGLERRYIGNVSVEAGDLYLTDELDVERSLGEVSDFITMLVMVMIGIEVFVYPGSTLRIG
jgi:hypothetical protein